MRNRRGYAKVFVLVILAALLFQGVSSASAYTGTEYKTSSDWSVGTIVSVNASGALVAASTDEPNYVGIVSAKPENGAVAVASTGTVPALVSDRNGDIKSGTRVAVSSIEGVAMIWRNGDTAIGIVQEDPTSWQTESLSDNGATLRIASVQVQLLTDGAGSTSSPFSIFFAAVQKTAAGVAGKSVDTWRIVTALLISVGGLILAFGLLFISSRESFFSMGRNPLAGKVIMRGLWKIVVLAVGIMCLTLGAAYLIVRIS